MANAVRVGRHPRDAGTEDRSSRISRRLQPSSRSFTSSTSSVASPLSCSDLPLGFLWESWRWRARQRKKHTCPVAHTFSWRRRHLTTRRMRIPARSGLAWHAHCTVLAAPVHHPSGRAQGHGLPHLSASPLVPHTHTHHTRTPVSLSSSSFPRSVVHQRPAPLDVNGIMYCGRNGKAENFTSFHAFHSLRFYYSCLRLIGARVG